MKRIIDIVTGQGDSARAGNSEPSATTAEEAIAAFAGRSDSSVWHSSLTRADVAARLRALLADPNVMDQGDLNVCGPATFFHLWIRHNPLAVVDYATSMFEIGSGRIGSLTIKPGSDLKAQNYGAVARSSTPPAEWMMLSALRDWENEALDFEGTPEDGASGITLPAELAKWMKASGAYRSVDDDGNWMLAKELSHALALAPSASCDVIILINANIIEAAAAGRKRTLLDRFPNHYVRLVDPITRAGNDVTFRYWTWGNAPATATVSAASFASGYFGSVAGQV